MFDSIIPFEIVSCTHEICVTAIPRVPGFHGFNPSNFEVLKMQKLSFKESKSLTNHVNAYEFE